MVYEQYIGKQLKNKIVSKLPFTPFTGSQNSLFGRLERLASQANMTKEEYAQYRHEWKVYNDYFNSKTIKTK